MRHGRRQKERNRDLKRLPAVRSFLTNENRPEGRFLRNFSGLLHSVPELLPDLVHEDEQPGMTAGEKFQDDALPQGQEGLPGDLFQFGVLCVETPHEGTDLGPVGALFKEIQDVVDNAPKIVKEQVSKAEADELKAKLEEQGAKVTLK